MDRVVLRCRFALPYLPTSSLLVASLSHLLRYGIFCLQLCAPATVPTFSTGSWVLRTELITSSKPFHLPPFSSDSAFDDIVHIFKFHLLTHSLGYGVVVLLEGHWSCDSQVTGSSPGQAPLHSGLGQVTYTGVSKTNVLPMSFIGLCASVTKQYNLVLAKEQLRSAAGKVN